MLWGQPSRLIKGLSTCLRLEPRREIRARDINVVPLSILMLCKATRRDEIQLEKGCRDERQVGESAENPYLDIEQRRGFQRKQKWPETEYMFGGRICIFPKPHKLTQKPQYKKKLETLNMLLPISS